LIYLDNNATTRPAAEVVAAMHEVQTSAWYNPSSVHRAGQEARRRIELARQSVAELIGAKAKSITFTSGGTEAIDLAIRGAVEATGKRAVVTDRVEHAAVRDLAEWMAKREGVEVQWVRVDGRGVVDVDDLARLVDESVGVVSVQWANNETGVVQPVGEVARVCRAKGVIFHCDGTQWVGKMRARVEGADALDVDLLTFSPHKWHGPKGVGVLYVRQGARVTPRIHGSQEKGRRGGTENVAGIVGAGVAAEIAARWVEDAGERERLGVLRDRFEARVLELVPDGVVNGAGGERLWNTTNIGFPRLEAEALLLLLSEKGVCASAGAACSSGSLDPSPVLLAMGVPAPVAHGSVRFSLSKETTEAELLEAARVVGECVARLRRSSVG
jgi:cysteine desulfurase